MVDSKNAEKAMIKGRLDVIGLPARRFDDDALKKKVFTILDMSFLYRFSLPAYSSERPDLDGPGYMTVASIFLEDIRLTLTLFPTPGLVQVTFGSSASGNSRHHSEDPLASSRPDDESYTSYHTGR
jgi:hypothetical protein